MDIFHQYPCKWSSRLPYWPVFVSNNKKPWNSHIKFGTFSIRACLPISLLSKCENISNPNNLWKSIRQPTNRHTANQRKRAEKRSKISWATRIPDRVCDHTCIDDGHHRRPSTNWFTKTTTTAKATQYIHIIEKMRSHTLATKSERHIAPPIYYRHIGERSLNRMYCSDTFPTLEVERYTAHFVQCLGPMKSSW